MLDISIQSSLSLPSDDTTGGASLSLAVLVGSKEGLAGTLIDSLDTLTSGALRRAASLGEFTGKAEQTCTLLAPCAAISRLVLVGYGDAPSAITIEAAGATATRSLAKAERAHLVVTGEGAPLAAHAAYGAFLSQYRFDLYRTQKDDKAARLEALDIHVSDVASVQTAWADLNAVAQGVVRARDFVSEPPNVLTPPVFAQRIEVLRDLGVEVEILGAAALQELGFGALMGVAQGSEAEARMVVMRWKGEQPDTAPMAFIGKGVTFDSGGISIKPAAGMEEMKTDMAGAATVVGLLEALARRKAKAHVVGLVGLVENMLSGVAQRPGDVVTSYSGQTIEVLNTDAEGRLVLADVLAYAKERFKPVSMVDLATLTGAIVVSLGTERAGLFSNDDVLAADLFAQGEEVGEALWRMPMGKAYDKLLRSDIADMKNIGGRAGGSITAAQFLARFVGTTPWAHLDIAGVAWRSDAGPVGPKGASGFGVRLLDAYVRVREGATGDA